MYVKLEVIFHYELQGYNYKLRLKEIMKTFSKPGYANFENLVGRLAASGD